MNTTKGSDHATRQPLVRTLLDALGRTAVHASALNQALATQLGIAGTDLLCLTLLSQAGPASAGQLAEELGLTTGGITGIVDRLEAAGFVSREADPNDRRRVIVCTVQRGDRELGRVYEPLRARAAQALERLSDSEIEKLVDLESAVADLLREHAALVRAQNEQVSSSSRLSVPLSPVNQGILEFINGARSLRIQSTETDYNLYEASFEGHRPNVLVKGGTVTVTYRPTGRVDFSKYLGVLALNPTVPWSIVVERGAAHLEVDAREFEQLRELTVVGGANQVTVHLPPPHGRVELTFAGGLNRVTIDRPKFSQIELQLRGGANRLEFDGQHFGTVGGDVRLATPGWDLAGNRYAIDARGGASRLAIQEL